MVHYFVAVGALIIFLQECTMWRFHFYIVDWLTASRVLLLIGAVALLLSFIILLLYIYVHQISKNITLILVVVSCFVGGEPNSSLPQAKSQHE